MPFHVIGREMGQCRSTEDGLRLFPHAADGVPLRGPAPPCIPLIRAVAMAPAVAFLDGLGAPVDRMLSAVQLRREMLGDPEAPIPLLLCIRFLELAARAEGVESLGVLSTRDVHPAALGTFGRRIARSSTLRDAIGTIRRLMPHFSSGEETWITRRGDEVRMHQRFRTSREEPSPQADWTSVMLHVNLLRAVAGPTWRPTTIGVMGRESSVCREAPGLADARVLVGQHANFVSFPATLLSRPLPRPAAGHVPVDAGGWERSGPHHTLGGSLRQVVAQLLPSGYPGIHRVAESVGMSARTLQRRLGDEGLTYARLVVQARLEQARRRLTDRRQKVIDVAFDLGYSDPAHFTRAFRSWTGLSPREFRRQRVGS